MITDKTRTARWPLSLQQRFEKNVMPEPMSGCTLWLAHTNNHGYGVIWANGKLRKAHRVAWDLYEGPIDSAALVLHKCDNPYCVNTKHLFVGNHKDNSQDALQKGRLRWAEGTSRQYWNEFRKRETCKRGHPTADYYDLKNHKCRWCQRISRTQKKRLSNYIPTL